MPPHPKMKPVGTAAKKHIFMGLYAEPGVGKTRLIGTLANTLIIRPPIDHTDSIRNPDNVIEWVVDGWNDMNEVEEYLHAEGKNHDFVWLDSASLFQDTGLDEIWADVLARKPERAKYGVDKGEYGINMTRFSRWVRNIVGMDEFNFGWTAHPLPYTPPATGVERLYPYIQGKQMPEKFCGYMNVVLYYEVVEGKEGKLTRVIRSQPTSDYFAKDQFDAFPNNRLVSPTMPKIIDLITAARKANGPKAAIKKTNTKRTTAVRRRRTA